MPSYQPLKHLGEGSYGEVYKARELETGRIVALKVIPKRNRGGDTTSEDSEEDNQREIHILQKIHHPNIVGFLGCFETEIETVLVMEYAGKSSLASILDHCDKFSEHQVCVFARQLVSALHYLHSNCIVHRDMKTDNIVLAKNNVLKLCDFGFAQEIGGLNGKMRSILGTMPYMSPELIKEEPYDYRADLWALGCILYELHTGHLPFDSASEHCLKQLIQKGSVEWPENMSYTCKVHNSYTPVSHPKQLPDCVSEVKNKQP
ncbi:serine/threonine-protein kinase 36-like [Aulostomus maculatus]